MKRSRRDQKKPWVSIVMGSNSDYPTLKSAETVLKTFKIPFETKIVSAHRTPRELVAYAEKAHSRGVRVIIAGAGGAAHLPGMLASLSPLPVIGVPVAQGALSGLDALLSIAQMPRGVPVASVAIGGAENAALLAIQILASGLSEQEEVNPLPLQQKIIRYKEALRKKVLSKKLTRRHTRR